MTPRTARRRLLALPVVALAAVGLAAVFGDDESVRAQSAAGPVGIEAQIGPALNASMLGPARETGVPGEAWALSTENVTTRVPKTVDGQTLPQTKDYILRYRPAEGWRYVQAPLDEQGGPFAGTLESGRVTAKGGLLLGGLDTTRPSGEQRVVLVRDATGPTRVVPAPASGILLPSQGSTPAEALSSSVLAARDGGAGRTEGFVAITGRPQQTGVARWDGTSWTRETICVAADGSAAPAGCSDAETLKDAEFGLTASALATVEGGDAWLLASAHADAGRGLVLFRRTGSGANVRWALRDIDAPRFAAAETPADGITAVEPLAGSHAAVATTDGVWIDGTFRQNGAARSVTLRITTAGTRSWCDGGACDAPLGFALRTNATSQAWADGSRIIGPVGDGTGRYARFDGTTWSVSAAFGAITGGIAFTSLDEGWLNDVHVTRELAGSPLAAWSVPVRRPLTAIASAPGAPAALETPALAVGIEGNVLRYTPGQGWDSEVRIGGSGVVRDDLRGVAWPEASTAFAVGDEGAMWRWRKATGLWESDPAAPFDFTGHLTGIAFQPGNPDRGFAVGRDGVLLRYGKSWEPVELPAAVATAGPGGGKVDLFGVAFAGSQAIAAAGGGGILVENGNGWQVDEQAAELLKPLGLGARIFAVSGLPDGGAVAAGSAGDNRGLVLERDGPTAPWRFSDQPPTGSVVAAAAFREEGQVRALVSVTPQIWPTSEDVTLPEFDPNSPAPRRAPLSIPVDGYLLRQTAVGWRDEERTKLASPTADVSRKSDPTLALLTDPAGRGWAVGGWNGGTDSLGRGPLASEPPRAELQTAAVSRYDAAGPQGSSNVRAAAPAFDAGKARLLVGGHAQCAAACADLAPIDISPDRTLARGLGLAAGLAAQSGGPTALAYTGGRIPVSGAGNVAASGAELQRYGALLGGAAVPTFPVVSAGEATGGTSSGFESVFGGSWAPFGGGAAGAGTRPVTIGAAPVPGRARTHYAVDLDAAGGSFRLVAIDNASGSLAARNAVGNPAQDQAAWLTQVLADAKARRLPVVVVGSRSLNARDTGAASDAAAVAAILRDGGASAYVFDGAGEQRRTSIPANSTVTLPSFSSGTLGYRTLNDVEGRGIPGLLLLELEIAARNATTNRAPVGVRLVPVLDDLAIDAVDGRLLNRSQPALFEGLGRRPRSGDTGDPYVQLPSPLCGATTREACAQTRIDPEVTFHSSDPDIADFVRVDRSSTNPRKPFVDPATDKPVADPTSGLICPFNAGTTTISVSSGGLTYSTTITVRDGSVLRPCGTVPLNPARFAKPSGDATPPPPASSPPGGGANPTSAVTVPPPPVPVAPAVGPAPPATPSPSIPVAAAAAVPAVVVPVVVPPLMVPPPPAAASPAPPPGTSGASINVPVSQPVTQAERQREEEVAEESSQAYARYESTAATNRGSGPGDHAAIVAAVLLAAIGGGTALGARRRHVNYAYARDRQTRTRRTR